MKNLALLLISAIVLASCGDTTTIKRSTDFNFDWKFTELQDTISNIEAPFADADWRDIRLPHDWSVEHSFDSTLEGCVGYLPGGVGVYQKHFVTPASTEEKNTYIVFDGVYNNSKYWINGEYLGENPYGYSPVYFDLTSKLKTDGSENIITVYVDHSRFADSRWYTGSGIYRNVKLVTVNKLHIPVWGTFITTPVITDNAAKVDLKVDVLNATKSEQTFQIETKIIDSEGTKVAEVSGSFALAASDKKTFEQKMSVKEPELWHFDSPNMYKAVTSIVVDGKVVDEYTTPFGIRQLSFEPLKGFFLNGEPTLVKGVCIHHAAGLVGAAVPRGVWKRRLQALKDGGVNAIRTSHNPFSEEFLDLCDEMGFLVQSELFDEFDNPKDKRLNFQDRHDDYITRGYDEHFQEWAKSDLTRTILRDRNHPCIYQWSIGNEIEWTYMNYRYVTGFWTPEDPDKDLGFWGHMPKYSPEELKKRYDEIEKGKYILTETAEKLNKWVKEIDTTRPTTMNMIIPQTSHVSGYANAVDIGGYSYRLKIMPWAQTYWPAKQVTINECSGDWNDWKYVLEQPGVFSMYMWTGIDYMGEAHDQWPVKGRYGDMLDLAGFKYPGWNFFKSIWVNEPFIAMGTEEISKTKFRVEKYTGLAIPKENVWDAYRWADTRDFHWNYNQGDTVLVEVASNYATVELLLNGKSLGYRSMSETNNRLFYWAVPYEPGTLTAKAGFNGEEIIAELKTVGKAVDFKVEIDNTKLKADGYDVAHFVVQLVDEKGQAVKTENAKVNFSFDGDIRLLGVDNGARDNTQDFQSNTIITAKGRTLAIFQSNLTSGIATVKVQVVGIGEKEISLTLK